MGINIVLQQLNSYVLVFCRIGGMIFFNPLLSRKNIPSQFRVALALGITLLLTPTLKMPLGAELAEIAIAFMMVKELFIGVVFGIGFQFFYFLLFTAGDIIDLGFGLSMAKAFDPGTNVQISISGNLFQLLFVMYFFATDSHLIFIKLMASSYDLISIGSVMIDGQVGSFLMSLFTYAFSLVMHLALPFIAASFVLEISMGILMKLIPQINVFAVHFQFKIIFAVILLFIFAIPVSNFLENYVSIMLLNLQDAFMVM